MTNSPLRTPSLRSLALAATCAALGACSSSEDPVEVYVGPGCAV